jgi:hypothetical protein
LSAKIADRNSLSLPASRNFSRKRASQTSHSVAVVAATYAKEVHVKAPPARCSTPFAQSVVKSVRFLLNLRMIARFTAAIVSEKSDSKLMKIQKARPVRSVLFVRHEDFPLILLC